MYSQSTVIAGGLAHIPVVIGVFSFIQKIFNKRALKFVEEDKTKKSPVKVWNKNQSSKLPLQSQPKTEAKPS